MYTLLLKYTIDRNMLSDWLTYGQAEFDLSLKAAADDRLLRSDRFWRRYQ